MLVDTLAVRLRPRTPHEAVDLGVRLCQSAAPSVYRCYLVVFLPVIALALASVELIGWYATIVIWWMKPWLDRTILFVLSRAAFGQDTTVADLWREQWRVWWRPLLFTLTVRRLSPWRSLTEPVYLLEDGPAIGSGARIVQIRNRVLGAAFMMSQAFVMAELAISLGLFSLFFWFAPAGVQVDPSLFFADEMPTAMAIANFSAYSIAVLLLEPFYVAAGFAMYLNRRAELEAWDIEQEFRRAFTHSAQLVASVLLVVVLAATPAAAQEATPATTFTPAEITAAVEVVKRDPNLGGERTISMLQWRQTQQPSKRDLGWLSWIGGLFGWFMQSARYLMWAAIVFLAAWLAVYLTRAFRIQHADAAEAFVPPTHVRNLDIRPESLPANIGGAARALWDRGEHRAALSLLYRGLLSRLTHVHRVPIRDSTTEGDCLVLLAGRVPPKTGEYSARLVDAWRGFVYGGTEAPATAIHALCDNFSGALDRAVARSIEGGTE